MLTQAKYMTEWDSQTNSGNELTTNESLEVPVKYID